jgi:hypothetical protein
MVPLWSDPDGSSHDDERDRRLVGHDDAEPVRPDWIAEEAIDAEEFLADHIADEMIRDPAIGSGQLTVQVQNGVVILQGHVDTPDTRSAAARRAWATPGVVDVCNMLIVNRVGRP